MRITLDPGVSFTLNPFSLGTGEVFEAHAATVIKVKILKDRTMRPYAFVQLLKVRQVRLSQFSSRLINVCGSRRMQIDLFES